jgi:WD repeat-containing protein 68
MRIDTHLFNHPSPYADNAPWDVFAMAWSHRPDKPYRLAVASVNECSFNTVEVIQLDERSRFQKVAQFAHPFPPTALRFVPDLNGTATDLIATTGDALRLWRIHPDTNDVEMCSILGNHLTTSYSASLTSMDWSESNRAMVVVSSIDSTLTLWNIDTSQAAVHMIAHASCVCDVSFSPNWHIFSSCGADGSVRVHDTRGVEQSAMLYEKPGAQFARVAWNKQDPNLILTFSMDSNEVLLLDQRKPATVLRTLISTSGDVNRVTWAPHSVNHLATGGADNKVVVGPSTARSLQSLLALPLLSSTHSVLFPFLPYQLWSLRDKQKKFAPTPIVDYSCRGEISNLQWSLLHRKWMAVACGRAVTILRV